MGKKFFMALGEDTEPSCGESYTVYADRSQLDDAIDEGNVEDGECIVEVEIKKEGTVKSSPTVDFDD